MALILTHILCLHISEFLKLRAEDFLFKASTVYIGPLKRQEAMRKPMLPEIKAMLLKFKQTGATKRRTEDKGSRGKATWWDKWRWPAEGLLFQLIVWTATVKVTTKTQFAKPSPA